MFRVRACCETVWCVIHLELALFSRENGEPVDLGLWVYENRPLGPHAKHDLSHKLCRPMSDMAWAYKIIRVGLSETATSGKSHNRKNPKSFCESAFVTIAAGSFAMSERQKHVFFSSERCYVSHSTNVGFCGTVAFCLAHSRKDMT